MFDVRPEDLGEPSPEQPLLPVSQQAVDDGSGDLVPGTGGGALGIRISEAKKALPKLGRAEEEKLAQAKRFAMEQSVHHVLSKQRTQVQQVDQGALQSSSQRIRALGLMCTIYVGSLSFQLNEESVRASFLPFGPIRLIDMSLDSQTQRHKGFAFVEYEIPEAAQLALEQMNNVMMGGRNIKCGRPSKIPQAAPWIEQILEEARQYNRIYVTSVHPNLTCQDIQSVFEAFGSVVSCELTPDLLTGSHKGYGFIEYTTQQSANDAITAMNLFDLGGQYIRVGRAITPPCNTKKEAPPPAASVLAASAITASIQGAEAVAARGATALLTQQNGVLLTEPTTQKQEHTHTGTTKNSPSATMTAWSANQPITDEQMSLELQRKKQEALDHKLAGENIGREEKLEISGKDARYMMMQKLTRAPTTGILVLRNMVTPEEIDEDLEDEITDECSRFGSVDRVVIYQEKQGEEEGAEVVVKIFVQFQKWEEGEVARDALNGRWFGGSVIQADLYDEDKYNAQDFSG